MNYCPKCDIIIRGNKTCCPLCQGRTGDVPDGRDIPELGRTDAFPVIEHRISSFTFMKLATFVFLTLEIAFGAVHWIMGPDAHWVSLVMLGIMVGWLDIFVLMYLRSNIMKLLTVESYVAIAVNIYVDYMTNMHGWSFAWVTPFMLLGIGFMTLTIAYVMKLRPSEYVTYIVFDMVMALMQFIPIHYGLNPVALPAIIIAAVYLVLMAAILVFQYNELKTALDRRFNF